MLCLLTVKLLLVTTWEADKVANQACVDTALCKLPFPAPLTLCILNICYTSVKNLGFLM